MLRNVIVLPNGKEISTGVNAVQKANYSSYANSGTDLTLGSVCSSMLDVKFFSPGGSIEIAAGTEIEYYKEDDNGNRTKIGLFTLETPERPSANTYKFTAYDRVSWLDKDISAWMSNLTGWPYTLYTLAQMVCIECGLSLVNDSIPNGDFPVAKFSAGNITGRRLMEWIAQLAARFVRATEDGKIEFAWYENTDIVLRPNGSRYYQSIKYEDYRVAKVDAVQIRLANSEYGLLWPDVPAGFNTYVISGNKLISSITEDTLRYLQVIQSEIANVTYTPCKITLPACVDIKAGSRIQVVDPNGYLLYVYVMSKTQKGQIETIECTGSPRRDNSTNQNNPTTKDLYDYADSAMNRQSQIDLFNKLTNNGQVQGLFIEANGQIYVNAAYISTGVLASKDGKSFYLDIDSGTFYSTGKFMSADGKSYITVEGSEFVLYSQQGENGQFQDIARIGFTEDSEGFDYPYFLMGSADAAGADFDKIGLIKMFKNGLYIGNSAPRDSSGSFVGLVGASGLFVDTTEPRPYLVNGMDMADAFECVFA